MLRDSYNIKVDLSVGMRILHVSVKIVDLWYFIKNLNFLI
jgi:hypothetical protein